MLDVIAEKLEQACEILNDLDLDIWMVFVRESGESGDPVLPVTARRRTSSRTHHGVSGRSAARSSVAICPVRRSGDRAGPASGDAIAARLLTRWAAADCLWQSRSRRSDRRSR